MSKLTDEFYYAAIARAEKAEEELARYKDWLLQEQQTNDALRAGLARHKAAVKYAQHNLAAHDWHDRFILRGIEEALAASPAPEGEQK